MNVAPGYRVQVQYIRTVRSTAFIKEHWDDKNPFPSEVFFEDCRFEGCFFTTDIKQCYFQNCDFTSCVFLRGTFDHVSFSLCKFNAALFEYGLTLGLVEFRVVIGLETSLFLHTVQVTKEGQLGIDNDLRQIQSHLNLREKWASWERLRTLGLLPLFGVSLSALVTIPIVTFLLGAYNDQIRNVQNWAKDHAGEIAAKTQKIGEQLGSQQLGQQLGNEAERLLMQLAERLNEIPLPNLTFWLLISTVFLGVASTLYTLFCPARIKEFSLDRWTDELGQPALHYLPLSWGMRSLRVIVGVCYVVGGLGTLGILLVKLWWAGVYIMRNTTLPWWWA
jgi:hypothetical protein